MKWVAVGVPSYFVFRQWSASTDIYGCGALSLYLLFWISQRSSFASDAALTDAQSAKIESEFAEMMAALESQPYFKFLWTDLEVARQELTTLPALTATSPDEAPKVKVSLNRWYVEREQADGAEQEADQDYEGDTVFAIVQETVKKLFQSVPHLRHIGAYFEWNIAYIAIFMHFVLSCLHYDEVAEESLRHKTVSSPGPAAGQSDDDGPLKPPQVDFAAFVSRRERTFCDNRLVKPSGGSAAKALAAFERFMQLQQGKSVVKFVSEHLKHVEFDPTPDPALRFRVQDLTSENARLSAITRGIEKVPGVDWLLDKINPPAAAKRRRKASPSRKV
jgi:hypothetical protein